MKILTKILFILLFSSSSSFIGLMLARFFIPKNAGLAGGAMVFWCCLLGLIIGLVASIIICRKASESIITKGNLILLVLNLGIAYYIYIRMGVVKTDQKEYVEYLKNNKPPPTATIDQGLQLDNLGIGMAKVNIEFPKTLYFYGNPSDASLPSENMASDSITLKQGDHYIDIATAPPWLVPEHLKLDYQILYFKVYAQNINYLQVEGNKMDSKKVWISKEDVSYMDWSEFLLSCHSIEAIHPQDNLVRVKPMNHADPMLNITEEHILQPIQVQSEWVQLDIFDQDYNKLKSAWIRWRNNEGMIIRYKLLS